MEYCLLENAFKENEATEKQRKHERKRYKKNKECFKFNPESTEADHPANLQPKGLSEAFEDINVTMPNIPATTTTATTATEGIAAATTTKSLPKHFTNNDDDEEGFTNNFTTATVEKGFEKSSGINLALPNISDSWKPLTPSNNNTAYFESLPTPGGTYPIWNKIKDTPREIKNELKTNDKTNDLQEKIDQLIQRLDSLEKQNYKESNQLEVLAFVGTGLFMILSLCLLK